ncbi:MAG: MauE/DoxX family redox-associated membrane protein [Actinomycetota bacterium]
MVETISPVGYGDNRARWLAAVGLHAIGTTAAAAAFGAVLGSVGALTGPPAGAAGGALVGLVATAYAGREALGLPVPVPAARRQVPDWWRSFFAWPTAALLYGAGLGIGFLTFLSNGGLVVVAVAAVVSGRPLTGALLLGSFGLARGLSPLVAWRVRSREAGTALVDLLAASDPRRWRWLNAGAIASVAVTALGALPRSVATGPDGGVRAGIAVIAAGLVAGTFAWAAVAKLLHRRRWRHTLAGYSLPAVLASMLEPGLPLAELGVPLAVLLGYRREAAWLALALLAIFSVAILRSRVRGVGDEIACGCFRGGATRDYRLLLARNALLAAVAATSISAPDVPLLRWPGPPGEGEVLPFALAVTAIAMAGFTAWRTATWLRCPRHA